MIICSYGCEKEAKYFFKSGKGCCEQSVNSCEGKRKKDSDKKKGSFLGQPSWKIEGFEFKPWNKGLTKETDDRLMEMSKSLSKSQRNKNLPGIASTPEKENERKRKISETMKKNPMAGGLRKGSGRGKKGWYGGYWCDSSWELAWVIYNIDHNIIFKRNIDGFEYIYDNQNRKYYPDFIIDNTYYEIKGRRSFLEMDYENQEKVKQFKYNLIVLYEKDMEQYLTYVIGKYGKDYITMYE